MPESPPSLAGSTDSALLFHTFAAALPQIVWTSVRAGEPDYFNTAWHGFTGLPESVLGTAAWSTVLHPDEAPAALAAWHAAGASGKPCELELRLRRADGAYRWHLVRSVPMKQPEGTVRFWLGTATDIHEQKLARGHLEQSEQRLALALEASNLGTWDWDIATDALSLDARCKQIFAIAPDAAPCSFYNDFSQLLHPDDRELIKAHVDASVRDRTTYRLEYRTVWPDGSIHWVYASGRAYYDAKTGQPTRMAGTLANIDERKTQEARFELAVAAAGLGLWYRDLPLRTITCNAIYRAQHGLAAEGPVTLELLQGAVHPDDWPRVDQEARRAIDEGASYDLAYRVLLGQGAQAPARWIRTIGRVFHDAHGRPQRFDGITLDITAERQLEESLRRTLIEKDESLRSLEIINSTGQALGAELKLEKLVQGVTDAATQLSRAAFGAFFYNVLDERGQSYMLYTLSGVPRESFEKFPMPRATQVFNPTFKGEGVIRSDDITKDARYGHNAPYQGMPQGHLPVRSYLAVPVASRSGEVLGGLFFGHPAPGVFTEREEKLVVGLAAQVAVAMDNARLYERAQEAITSRDTFLSIASHELRTPLTSMKMHAQHMRKRIAANAPGVFTPGSVARLVDQTERSIGKLSRLVEDMLDISRIATGRLNMQREPVELSTLTREVVDRFAQQLVEAGNGLELQLAPGIVGTWDRDRLEQVLANLLTNILKYAPGVPVIVRTRQVGHTAILEVQDRGPGIAPGDQHRVFERFERLADANQVSGLGLGLHIAKHIVEAHGGTIRVRSAVGDGATFIVELPVTAPSEPQEKTR